MKPSSVLIVGAGGVLGTAMVREFSSAGYQVATLRRGSARSDSHAAFEYFCDLGNPAEVQRTAGDAASALGGVDVLIHNAAQFTMGPFLELTDAQFDACWRAGGGGAAAAARAILPAMLAAGQGAMLFSGATGSVRGSARFSAFSAAKFGLRGLAQSLAREYHSHGIHVAHVVLDGLLRGSPSVERFGGRDALTIDPAEAARTYRWLAEQPASAWTHELDLRPKGERF
jgi:NAD(P)-dependent dehydrogenase (short-subunit alcohol dehydrogenase family)